MAPPAPVTRFVGQKTGRLLKTYFEGSKSSPFGDPNYFDPNEVKGLEIR